MIKRVLAVALTAAFASGAAQAASFLNGGFEDNNFSGWTQGSGYNYSNTANITGTALALNPASFEVGGSNYNAGYQASAITNVGKDAIDTNLDTVRYGNHAVRVNDRNDNFSVNTIRQSVTSYDGTSINFSWAAVLESSHDLFDSDIFGLSVTDDTLGTTLYSQVFSSASAPGIFTKIGSWYSSGWQDITLAVTKGNNFTISLLAADCPYGAHAGYVYLDGFGTVAGGGGDNGTGGNGTVPEPASIALLGVGLVGMVAARRRKTAQKA